MFICIALVPPKEQLVVRKTIGVTSIHTNGSASVEDLILRIVMYFVRKEFGAEELCARTVCFCGGRFYS